VHFKPHDIDKCAYNYHISKGNGFDASPWMLVWAAAVGCWCVMENKPQMGYMNGTYNKMEIFLLPLWGIS
jgi:hypothetical protein